MYLMLEANTPSGMARQGVGHQIDTDGSDRSAMNPRVELRHKLLELVDRIHAYSSIQLGVGVPGDIMRSKPPLAPLPSHGAS
jgi:hypothetical protein